jgi:hypothetical protein
VGHFGSSIVDIVDISDPADPTRVAEYLLPPPNQAASAQDVKVGDGLLFISLEGSGNSVHIVDVRDPATPIGLVDVAIDGFTEIHNTFYHGGYLYMADSGTPQVGIVDLTDFDPDDPPAEPITQLKWMVMNVGTSFVHDVTVVGSRLYASAWDSGIWIYDITDVANRSPSFRGSGPGDNTHSAWPTDDGAYVVTGEERSGGGIVVYRITDDGGELTLEITDAVALPPGEASSVHNQVTIGNRVYNSWYAAGLRVYDVDRVTGTLEFVAGYDTELTGSIWGVYPLLGPERVLLSGFSSGLTIVEMLGCPADTNGDGQVDVADLIGVVLDWGCTNPLGLCSSDVNDDGVTDVLDLTAVILAWGPCE